MEPHKKLDSGIERFKPPLDEGAQAYFDIAREFASAFYKSEIDQISSVKFDKVEPDDFFHECIWVIHATGFSAKAVGKFFGKLILCKE